MILSLPDALQVCIGVLIGYLRDFKLEGVFHLINNFRQFSSTQHMLLNGTTLNNLEVLTNSTTKTEKGSLFWGNI